MTPGQFMEKATTNGIRISIAGSDLDVRSVQPLTDDQLDFLKRHKSRLIAELNSEAGADAKLLEALSTACHGLPIAPTEVREALAPEDVDDWLKGNISSETLAAFAQSMVQRREMDQGKAPAQYTERAVCKQCGPVWLWFAGEVLGCPWCWNRIAGRPIPHPQSVHCGDCAHFKRIDHPNLGHCAKGQPEAIAGLWDTDRRMCSRWQSIHSK